MNKARVLCACLCLGLLGASARASVTFEYVTDQSSYTPDASGNATVSLFLQETISGTSQSLLASEGGLFGAGVYVTENGTGTSSTATITSLNKNTAFNGNISQQASTTQARLLEDNFNGTTGVNGTVTGSVTRVLLGTVVLKAGTTATSFSVEPYKFVPTSFGGSGVDGNTLTFTNGFDVDINGASQPGAPDGWNGADAFNGAAAFSFTVAAVPEPSSVLLCSLPACGMVLGLGYTGYRRRRAQLLKAAAA